jgi:predicted MFS family arabinose efflux permease
MRRPTFSENMTVFVLFFGISLLDALASRVWWRAAFWLAIAMSFAALAWIGQRRQSQSKAPSS